MKRRSPGVRITRAALVFGFFGGFIAACYGATFTALYWGIDEGVGRTVLMVMAGIAGGMFIGALLQAMLE